MEISETSISIFIVSKVLALAPYSLYKNSKGVYVIQKSVPFIFYASSMTMIMVFLTYRGLLYDANSKMPVRMKSATSKVVTALDVSVVVFAIVAGVVCGLVGLDSTKELNNRFHKVDTAISGFINLKKERLKANLLVTLPMLTIGILLGIDLWSWLTFAANIRDDDDDPELNVEWYIPFYGLYFVLTGLHVTFANTALGLWKRFKSVNLMLKTSFLPMPRNKEQGKSKITTVKTTSEPNTTLQASLNKLASENYQINGKTKSLLLKLLAENHESLGKCVTLVSSSYGLTVLFILLSCFLHLLATAYFLFIGLLDKKDSGYMWLQILWIMFHGTRLLMVVEPCHRIAAESMKTIHIVCEIQRAVHDSILGEEVKKFWQQLLAYRPEFSACGLCMVNRGLIASLGSAIATYLVILIQFHKTNG